MKKPVLNAVKCAFPGVLLLASILMPSHAHAFPKEGQKFFTDKMQGSMALSELNFKLPSSLMTNEVFKHHGAIVKKNGDYRFEVTAFTDGEGSEGLVLYTTAMNKNISFEKIKEPMKMILMSRLKRYYPKDGNRFDMGNEKLSIGSAYAATHHSTYNVSEGETCAHIVANTGMKKFADVNFKTPTFLEFSYCEKGQASDVRKKALAWASEILITN